MAVRTFQGDEQLLFIINEQRIKFRELRTRGYNLLKQVRTQEWQNYFAMLKGSIFPVFVKEFWVNAPAPFEGNKIRSSVFEHSIRITRTIISYAIECQD